MNIFSPCVLCKDSSAASLIYTALVHTVTSTGAKHFCYKNHRNTMCCDWFRFWKQFHSLLHYVMHHSISYCLTLGMQIFPQGNEFKWFAHWSQGTLQNSNLKNTWSSMLEGFPSLLSGLSLNLPREHSAQFMTFYRLNICFCFPFFLLSTFHNWSKAHAAEEGVEMQDETCCVPHSCVPFCQHDKAQQSEEWKSPSPGISVSGLYGHKKTNSKR